MTALAANADYNPTFTVGIPEFKIGQAIDIDTWPVIYAAVLVR